MLSTNPLSPVWPHTLERLGDNSVDVEPIALQLYTPKLQKEMGDSWEDEEFEVPTFSAAVKESWDDEVDEAQVCIQWDNDVVVLF
jgi:hypothetical protein